MDHPLGVPATCVTTQHMEGCRDVATHEHMNACSQDAAGSVTEMLKEARTISQAFGAVAEGGNRQVQKYKALLNA